MPLGLFHHTGSLLLFRDTLTMEDMMTYPEMKKALQEREQKYLSNMAWLDQDLERLVEEDERKKKIYEENLAWLDKDLAEKIVDDEMVRTVRAFEESMALASKPGEQLVRQPLHEVPVRNASKIWHCGHGGRTAEAHSLMKKFHDRGVKDNSCFIHHGHSHCLRRGFNTTKQFERFRNTANEGDIIFTHCAKKGGLTHYGYYTGEIIQEQSPQHYAAGEHSVFSFIHVYEWIPLPEALRGAGRNSTLYEVKPESKNYQNYSIMS